ncbi:DUF2304 domain-containing protein [Patescibacteria group bacterium]|nr:DUF2304 domain-containing protein [Patescibacteria group bacterium]MBU1123900.1 DUF2304 domain-containing protein [Patescibacteria group bacterium]MBU1911479.1 DUF2304 domain-containing protein [Patescibacteria group bacterium]
MDLTLYQLLAPIVAFVAIAYAWSLVFRQKKTLWEGILWTLFWGLVALIALFPAVMTWVSTIMGIKNRENAVFITFFGVLFFMVFYMVMRLEALEQRQTRIVRKIALKDADIDGKEDKMENG